jgi:hypothetical protein
VKKKKKVIFRSIPKSKILKNFRANIFLNFYQFFDTKKQINYNFIYHFFFNDFLCNSMPERVFFFTISGLKNLLLKFTSNIILLLLFLVVYKYVFTQTSNSHFFSFFLKIFGFQLTETKEHNFLPFIVQLAGGSVYFYGINMQFFGYERFIKSHLTTNFFKNKMFSIEQGFNENYSNFNENYAYSTNRNFFYFFEKYFKPKWSLYRQPFFTKKRFVYESLKNFIFSDRRFFTFNFLNIVRKDSSYYSIRRVKFLFILLTKFKFLKFTHNFMKFSNFSLSYTPNVLFFFDSKINLDIFASISLSMFFFTKNLYNFFYLLYGIYKSDLVTLYREFSLLINLEFIFFKKRIFFKPSDRLFGRLHGAFLCFSKVILHFKIKPWRKFNKFIKPFVWFDYWNFTQEIVHLAQEYIFCDFEKVQQLTWSKQLAELRLVKLTEFLKNMRAKKIDIGEVQYSPDFTQLHEFALTLKWGFELEQLRKTKLIILWRFFGTKWWLMAGNFIWKKLNFLYNIKKLWFNVLARKNFIALQTHVINILSLKNVYEIAWLQFATIVASYWNVYKVKYFQFNSFHWAFNFIFESDWKALFNYLYFVYSRHFFFESYQKYYLKNNFRRWIGFTKMIKKKVFNNFMMKSNFFYSFLDFKTSYDSYMFFFYQKIKQRLSVFFKDPFFYKQILHLINFQFKSLLIPNLYTSNFQMLYLNLQMQLSISKNFYFNFLKIKTASFYSLNHILELSRCLKFLSFFDFSNKIYKRFFCTNNSSNFFYNHLSNKDNQIEDFEVEFFSTYNYLENFYINFCSEFFYEIFNNNFLIMNWKNSSNKFANKMLNGKFFSKMSSTTSSFSFFYSFNTSFFGKKQRKNINIYLQLIVDFQEILLDKKILKNFLKDLLIYISGMGKQQFNLNLIALNKFNSFTIFFLKKFLIDKTLWLRILNNFFFWLFSFDRKENIEYFLLSLIFLENVISTLHRDFEFLFVQVISKILKSFIYAK